MSYYWIFELNFRPSIISLSHRNISIKKYFFILVGLLCACSSYVQGVNGAKPNIVIITTDQQFAEAMSSRMGKEWITTPNMDRLSSEGVVFTRAYAASPLCAPSRNSFITGQYPHITGIETNADLSNFGGSEIHYWTNKDFKSLGRYFKNAGYKTAYFGKWHLNYKKTSQAAHGFENAVTFPKPDIDALIPNAVDKYLKNKSQEPFLLFASFVNPHDICQWARFQKLPEGPIAKVPSVSQLPPLKANLQPPKNETDEKILS